MLPTQLPRWLTFIIGWVVGGLALAFVIVALRPELLIHTQKIEPAPTPVALSAPLAGHVTYADAVARAAPAVVNIYTARLVTERVAPSGWDQLFGNFLPRYRQRVERSLGSGVIVDKLGHIVTNHHVIANADSIKVQLADGRVADAHIVGRDPDTDLAVLQIDLTPLPVVTFGRSDRLRAGRRRARDRRPDRALADASRTASSAPRAASSSASPLSRTSSRQTPPSTSATPAARSSTRAARWSASIPPSSRRTWASRASASPFR